MQTIDISKILPLLGNISVRGRGYVEAIAKILQGQELTNAGLLELQQLDGAGGGSEVTDTVRALINKTWDVAMLKGFLKKEGPLSSGQMAIKIGVNPDTIRRALMKEVDVRRTGIGGATKWTLLEKKQARKTIAAKTAKKTKKASHSRHKQMPPISKEEQEKDDADVLKYIKAHPNASMQGILTGLKRSFYPIKRALVSLESAGKIKESAVAKPKGGTRLSWELLDAK